MICEFETPVLISFIYPVAIILGIWLSFFVLFKDKKGMANQNAFYFILLSALWVLNDFFEWTVKDFELNLFFSRLSYFSDLIYLFFLFFAYDFVGKPLCLRNKALLFLPILPHFFFFSSDFFIQIWEASSCDFVDGSFTYYSYFLDLVYLVWGTIVILRKNYSEDFWMVKYRARIIVFSVWFFLFAAFIYCWSWNETLSKEASYYFIAFYFIFIFLLTLAIVRWRFLVKRINVTVLFLAIFLGVVFLVMIFLFNNIYFSIILVLTYLTFLLILKRG